MRTDQADRLQSLLVEARLAHEAGDVEKMSKVLDNAFSAGIEDPVLLRTAAEVMRSEGRIVDAGQLLNRALTIAPDDAETIAQIGRLFVDEGRTSEAIDAFRAALRIQPGLVAAWNSLAAAFAGERKFDAASAAFQRVSLLSPGDPDPLAALSLVEVRRGRLDSARKLASQALTLHSAHPLALLTLARVEVDDQNFASAKAKLELLLAAQSLNPSQRQTAWRLLGDALDGLGLIDEAFNAYGQVKRAFAAQHARRFGPGGAVENHVAFIDRLRTWFERQDMSGWSAVSSPVDSPVRQHVFLLGYLRSGVTLVESILASLSGTRVLEEADTLRVADSIFLRNDESLARLNPLDPVAAQHARDAYWKRVREKISDVDGKLFVDMSPLYGIKLPMIARLFPNAICVVCRRDPRDVVLSCFRRNFKVNALTYQLTSLESIARHYDAAQSLTERHLQVLPMPRHFVEYSRLVRDFDGTTKALAEFIGADWTERVREFNSTAASLPIATPSAMQVRKALFDGGDQWRRYCRQIESVLPTLRPWVEKFGYLD